MMKSTYGTGCFALLNTGSEAVASSNRLLTTIAYRLQGTTTYALEGSIFMAGAAVQWLRDGLHLFDDAGETAILAAQAHDESDVYMVPAFTGLGAPYWDAEARGALLGLTRDTGIAEVVRATLDAVCYQTRDLMEAMLADAPTTARVLRVDGGMVVNDWVMQRLADLVGVTVDRPQFTETTALGAAYLAGMQAGVFGGLDELAGLWQRDAAFEPALDAAARDIAYAGWQDAVRRVRSDRDGTPT
jgi:glycerol kinase